MSVADTVMIIRRIFWFLMGCDSFRFVPLSSNYGRERDKRRYFGCRGPKAGLPVQPRRGREKRSAQAISADRRIDPSPQAGPANLTKYHLLEVQFQSELK